jgi:hypothetical protein
MSWQIVAASVVAGFSGAIARDVVHAILRSDWLFGVMLRADLRTIRRAQRRRKQP